MAKIVIVPFLKTKLKIQLSPKLTKNLINWNIQTTMPALLKGFIDRTFLLNFAFKYRENSPFWDKLLQGKPPDLSLRWIPQNGIIG